MLKKTIDSCSGKIGSDKGYLWREDMSEELTDLQLRILKALGKEKREAGEEFWPTRSQLDMDDFYYKLQVEVSRSRFREDVCTLEHDGYIRKVADTGDFGGYAITIKRVKCLRSLEEGK